MKHLLILLSLLLLSSPLFGQSSKYESVGQCVLQTMTEKKLTGNQMFKLVKDECERILGNGKVGISKSQENVLFISVKNNELKWNKSKNRNTVGKYDGQIGNNLPNGFGVLKLDNGIIYEGDWLNGKYHGKGELILGSGKYKGDKYIGDFINGFKDGVGTYFHKNGSKYKGQWKKDKFHGTGIYIWIDGGRYEGEFKMGLKHGKGKELLSGKWKGDKYDGEYSFGLKSGKGVYTYKNGYEYKGIWKKDKPWDITVYDNSGRITGKIKNGVVGRKVEKQWTKQLGTSSDDFGEGVTTDSSGNIYVTGTTNGGLDGNTSSGYNDIVLVKYNLSGTKQWTKQLGTSWGQSGEGVTTDSSGNLYLTGSTEGGLDGNTNSGEYDIFLIKFNSSGIKQ